MLIDEYDKPMIDSLNKTKEVHQEIKETLDNFYQVIKGSDEHIKFMFMTGVSRFSGLSIFSALNNLNDITMNNKYTSICGYTQEELESSFKEHIESTREEMGLTKEELLRNIKYWYNGYSWDGKVSVYNPFSTLKFFDTKKFEGYWFETGTPTFLIEEIKKREDIKVVIEAQEVESRLLRGADDSNVSIISLLFQTGYLTVKKEESTELGIKYRVDFPNYEVRKAFLEDLLVVYGNRDLGVVHEINQRILRSLREKDATGLSSSLREYFAHIPSNLHTKRESYYHSLLLVLMKAVGYEVEGEVYTDKGRIDVVLRKEREVIVVEIKYGENKQAKKMLQEGMRQIRDKKYYEKVYGERSEFVGSGI
jgi:hypothetical protein